jgi:CBS domain-containing protein
MYAFVHYQVQDVMTRGPVTVAPETSIIEAQALFEKHDFNGLPVVDREERLLGVVTKLDLLKAFIFRPDAKVPHYDEIMGRPVSIVMTKDFIEADPTTPLTRVLEIMVGRGFKSLPVAVDGRVVGMVSREDILRALRRAAQGRPPERTEI